MVTALVVPILAQAEAQSRDLPWGWIIGVGILAAVGVVVLVLLRAGRAPGRQVGLVVTKGAHSGETFVLDAAITSLGTAKDNDIVITDDKVGPHHARLRITRTGITLADRNTLYGTYLNGDRIETAECSHGDRIRLGTVFECRIEIGSERT